MVSFVGEVAGGLWFGVVERWWAKLAPGNAMGSAYQICQGQSNAVRPTHSTIEATLVLGLSSSQSVPSFVPTTRQTTLISKSASLKAPTTTTSIPSSSSSSSSRTSSQPTETDPASNSGDAEEAENGREDDNPSSGLSTPEIAGLAAGLAAAFAIAIVLICLARRRRKKHFPDIETSFIMANEPIKALSRRFSKLPRGQNISSPLHGSPNAPPKEFPMGEHGAMDRRRRTFIFPKAVQRANPVVRKGSTLQKAPPAGAFPVAGLAVTAPSAVPMAATPPESPPNNKRKPVLSLSIPKNPATPSAGQQNTALRQEEAPPKLLVTVPTFERENPGRNNRKGKKRASKPTVRAVDEEDDGSLTEFEEDGRDSPVQVWRPPSLAPQSASTLYVADKFGNWVLADERQKKRISLAELEGSSPTVVPESSNVLAEDSLFNGPGPSSAAGALRPPAEIHRRVETGRHMPSMTSSVYSYDIPARSPAPPVPRLPMPPKPPTPQQTPLRSRYSPVLNPFLDENGVSPVRSMYGSARTPGRAHPSTPRNAMPRGVRVHSPPGQPSPTLGVAKPARRGPQTPQQPMHPPRTPEMRTYNAVPSAAFSSTPQYNPSLLAKRVGAEKAANLSLRDSEASKGSRGRSSDHGQLLTPERRGDDLYLSLN